MNKKIFFEYFEKLELILIGLFIFFGYVINKESIQLLFTVIVGLIPILKCNMFKIKITKNDLIWIGICLLSFISTLYSIDKESTLRYSICLFLVIILKIITLNYKSYKKSIVNILAFFSSIHVFATLIYAIFPNFIHFIIGKILTASAYEYNLALMRHGMNAGISSEHGFNAFCITVFICIFFVRFLYNKEKKILNFIFTIIGILALLLTGKRGLLVANAISMIVIFIIVNLRNKKILKKSALIFLIILAVSRLMLYIPATKIVFERFQETSDEDDMLNGREDIYKVLFENIVERPFFGSGAKTTGDLTGGNDGHNIYLQIVSELGIIGILVYFLVFKDSIVKLLKALKFSADRENVLISAYYQIFFLVYGLTGNPLYNFSILLVYMLMINLTISINKKEELK